MDCSIEKLTFGSTIDFRCILKSCPQNGQFEITDYTNTVVVVINPTTRVDFNFSMALNKAVNIVGIIFPMGANNTKVILLTSIECGIDQTNLKPVLNNISVYNQVNDLILELKSMVKSGYGVSLSSIFKEKTLIGQIQKATADTVELQNSIVLACIIKKLEDIVK